MQQICRLHSIRTLLFQLFCIRNEPLPYIRSYILLLFNVLLIPSLMHIHKHAVTTSIISLSACQGYSMPFSLEGLFYKHLWSGNEPHAGQRRINKRHKRIRILFASRNVCLRQVNTLMDSYVFGTRQYSFLHIAITKRQLIFYETFMIGNLAFY